MTQPNVYWTLRTPMVNIIGLYSNVPEGGDIRSPQLEWLTQQIKSLPKSLPLFLTLHHPVYSADTYHSGSTHMKEIIEAAAKEAGRHPDMVLAGHVHNFQRISKDMGDGTVVPYLVAGAGGYHNLHSIMKVDGEKLIAPTVFEDKEGDRVTLEKYSDDNHGFLRLEVTDTTITGRYYTVPRPQDPYSKGSSLLDYFEYDWKKHQYVPNTLQAKSAKKSARK
ncbi:metallophosphoesterase family protein [Ralstonia sp. A12]|uniref:metallophosphoesterase family protein n=1 Tax=Ralstonia sp. A12 TaxID=1217052 RepID=UPI0012ED7AB8|nr:metallophosphoesterase [Ralstonia sp. A12]